MLQLPHGRSGQCGQSVSQHRASMVSGQLRPNLYVGLCQADMADYRTFTWRTSEQVVGGSFIELHLHVYRLKGDSYDYLK